jgi:hypothetical protein
MNKIIMNTTPVINILANDSNTEPMVLIAVVAIDVISAPVVIVLCSVYISYN